jgi:hypothetical protein
MGRWHRPPPPRRHLRARPRPRRRGGRELAYVALSRARDGSTIHATVDDLEQAIDDLHAAWGSERHQRWISDTAAQVGWDLDDADRVRRLETPDHRAARSEAEIDVGIELGR